MRLASNIGTLPPDRDRTVAENSKIEWCDHTFNPWVGCTKISPACDNCYAESWAKRTGSADLWSGNRRRTTPANWQKPLKWNREHDAFFAEHGRRQRVFCASLADVFDNEVPHRWRHDLFQKLISQTGNLDWLLLTKRIGNVRDMIAGAYMPSNVWIGATVVTQAELDRDVPKLMDVNARTRFLSCEPLLEEIDLRLDEFPVDWVIVGGESGPNARPLDPDWCKSIAMQCEMEGVAFFMKQGSQANWPNWKDFSAWPELLQRRELPRVLKRQKQET